MKIKKQCPECGGTEIFKTQGKGGYAPSELLPSIGGMFVNKAYFDVYVCCSCGYSQFFVPDNFLDEVRQKFEPQN